MRSEVRILFMASAVGLGVLAAVPAGAADMATVSASNGYLVGPDGMSLYLFEPDNKGASTCYDKCAAAWPPLTTTAEATAGKGAMADMLGTTKRKDGTMQVTYGGWPLYTFVKDKKRGDTAGQGVEGFGGEWYLVEPSGEAKE